MSKRVEWLRRELMVLASEPGEQLRHLREIGISQGVDELALDYDAIAAAAPGMLRDGEITQQQCDCVTRLHEYFGQFSGTVNAHLWTDEALANSEEWTRVRSLAHECLALFTKNMK